MREILFRGKRIDNGEWKEGSYVYQHGCHMIYLPSVDSEYGFDNYHIHPETVGQFTGLTDKNGKKIFEGDIVSFKRINALGYTTCRIGKVRYDDELPIFYILSTTGDAWDWVYCEDIEVIGNIHDNPELLHWKEWDI